MVVHFFLQLVDEQQSLLVLVGYYDLGLICIMIIVFQQSIGEVGK